MSSARVGTRVGVILDLLDDMERLVEIITLDTRSIGLGRLLPASKPELLSMNG